MIADLNAGNVLPVDLGADGVYEVTVYLDEDRPPTNATPVVSGLVGCDSGTLIVGPGEDITGGDLEPDGFRLPCPPGTYRVWVAAPTDGTLSVWLEPVAGPSVNHFADFPRIGG